MIELQKLNSSQVKEEHKKLYQWACFICAEGEEERAMIEKDLYIEEAIRELELLERDPERMDEYLFRQKKPFRLRNPDGVQQRRRFKRRGIYKNN